MSTALGPLVLGGAAVSAVAWWALPGAAPVFPPLARAYRIPCRLSHTEGVALTFDDGPHPEGTPAMLELLAQAGASATFFLVGEQVERWPALAAEIAAAGHEIGLHGYRHRLLLGCAPSVLERDLERAAAVIGEITGRAPTCYRPPYGVFSAVGLRLVRRRGWLPLLWSKWARDWEARATPTAIAQRATRGLAPGDVVLLHDADHYSSAGSWRRTAAAVPRILEAAGELGVPLVAVSQST